MDESMLSCADRIAADLHGLGISAGETVLVHSSFRSLGPVPGGIETLVGGLQRAIGDSGTLLMPALCWNLRPPERFDLRRTPAVVGAVPEYFRTRPGTLRSLHPTHSVCAAGRRAREWIEGHERDRTPCGPHSPFSRLTREPAKIVMLGCGLRPNTTMHALEECSERGGFLGRTFLFALTDGEGVTYRRRYRVHDFSGYRQRYDRLADLPDTSFCRRGRLLAAETFVLDTIPLRDAVLRTRNESPLFFVERLPS